MDQPWFVVTLIICVGSALWLAACVAVAAVVRYRRRRKLLASNKYINGAKPGKSVSSGLRNPTYTKRLEILGIDSLELLRRHYDLVYVFKMFFFGRAQPLALGRMGNEYRPRSSGSALRPGR